MVIDIVVYNLDIHQNDIDVVDVQDDDNPKVSYHNIAIQLIKKEKISKLTNIIDYNVVFVFVFHNHKEQ